MISVLEIKQGDIVRFLPAHEIMTDIKAAMTLKELEFVRLIGEKEAVVSQVYTAGRPVEQVGYPFFTIVGAPGKSFKAGWAKKVIFQPGKHGKVVGKKLHLVGR